MWKYLFFILLFIVSCKKEKQEAIQTIYPLPYLPVYPGSKWTYLNQNGDTLIQSTAPEYQLHQYQISYGYKTDNVYVPFWNGKPIYGYSTPDNDSPYGSPGETQIGYLSEKKGEQFYVYGSNMGSSWRVVENIDTNITVNSINYNNVIEVRKYYFPQWGAGAHNTHLSGISYYAKNIGLIKEDYYLYDTLSGHIDMISYFINH